MGTGFVVFAIGLGATLAGRAQRAQDVNDGQPSRGTTVRRVTAPSPVSAPRWRGCHLSCPLHSAGAGYRATVEPAPRLPSGPESTPVPAPPVSLWRGFISRLFLLCASAISVAVIRTRAEQSCRACSSGAGWQRRCFQGANSFLSRLAPPGKLAGFFVRTFIGLARCTPTGRRRQRHRRCGWPAGAGGLPHVGGFRWVE